MTQPNPKKWFTSPIAKISCRKVDKWAERMRQHRPYFDTWEEAHQWMLVKAKQDLEAAKKRFASAERHLKKVQQMSAQHEQG